MNLAVLLSMAMISSGVAADDLERNFISPPPSARPWVYWFALSGNLSSNGITADLEAMARAGIGGVLYMEVDQGAPPGPADFAGPLWRDLFRHVCAEAERLGLEINMNNDAGWTGSGGPWIPPELSMQVVVASEVRVTGPVHFAAALPQPKANLDFYRDIAVLAFPTPAADCRIPNLRGKSGAARAEIPLRTSFPPCMGAISKDRLKVLTDRLGDGGRLVWDVPAGAWTILRVGHTTTGQRNHPAPPAGRGLECDKLSKEAVELHFHHFLGQLIADNASRVGVGRPLVATHVDSWEVGAQNWTPRFREEFRRLRGYDLLPFLPVFSGYVVESLEVSERFLWDVRQTIHDLLCENYAGHLRALAHRHGMRLSIEAYGGPCQDLPYAGRADEPMGEFWSWSPWGAAPSCTEMASAAHVYGRPIVGAEAFTATDKERWQGHPANIKALGDWAFCEGINRFVVHRYALQPWTQPEYPPGMSMGPWGLHYERTQTWWDMSRAWHEYLARCQALLQRGLFVADLCFLVPERSPQGAVSPVKGSYDRPGYNFDLCPPEVVLTRMAVSNGWLVLPDGMRYRLLVLPRVETMTPKLLGKIRDLVYAGATVMGIPPKKSPSLEGYPQCDEEVRRLVAKLWGEKPGEQKVGRGRVVWPAELQPEPERPYEGRATLGPAQWIWYPESDPRRSAPPGVRYFRRVVLLDTPVRSATLVLTADNRFDCWINGKLVARGSEWSRGYVASVGHLLRLGTNVILVKAENTTDAPNPAGVIGGIQVRYADGREQTTATDATWEAARQPDGPWTAVKVLGPLGIEPWGKVEVAGEDFDVIPNIEIPIRWLAQNHVRPDFSASANVRYIHKRVGETDVYFIANPEPRRIEVTCQFRVVGKEPELWWPETGRIEPAPSYEIHNDFTTVPLRLEPIESVFVVWRRPASEKIRAGRWPELQAVQELEGPWEVRFDPTWGGPRPPVVFQKLEDWSQRPEPEIRYYSGTALYRTTFDCPSPKSWGRAVLDLGRVEVMAAVKLNGRDLGVVWKPPYRVEISETVMPGRNTLELQVVNLWINRMIGDEQLPEDSDRNPNGTLKSWPSWLLEGKPSPSGRFTFTSWRLWKKDDPLVPSGLLGPVQILRVGMEGSDGSSGRPEAVGAVEHGSTSRPE
jgi:hypothetical protein